MIMPGPNEGLVRCTGGQVDDMVMALIDAAFDQDSDVRDIIQTSLLTLGRKQPELVLSSCFSYLKRHSKLATGHRVVILNAMEKVVRIKIDDITESLAVDLVKQASDEMTHSKEVVPDWQTAASNMLAALGSKYSHQVMEELIQRFQPGALPHFFVVQSMGNLASENVYGIVPFLPVVMATTLPMLGMAKADNMRWVFSSAIGKFSEAILDYIANIEKAPDKNVRLETFAGEIYSAFDTLFNVWLLSKELKVQLTVVESVGYMVHIISQDSLKEQLPKIIHGILGLYKKHPDAFLITQALCNVLSAAVKGESTILDPHLDLLLGVLFSQVCIPLDYNHPATIKNHNELLRCFAVIASAFSDRLVGFLLQKMEARDERTRIATLSVFKHLINSSVEQMEDKKPLIISGLKMLFQENNNKVKKVFAQAITAMAHHSYLELEGGHLMVEFIIRQCTLPDDPPVGKRQNDPEHVTNQALRSMCENVLQLMTTTIKVMEDVLWPYILEFIVPDKFFTSFGPICRSIADLGDKKRTEEDEEYMIDYEQAVNVPKPAEIIARMMVMAGLPYNGNKRGVHVLNAMKSLSPNLHEAIVNIWDTVIPKLVQHFEETEKDDWSQKNWEDLVLKLLSKTLDEVEQEDWIVDLGLTFTNQIALYMQHSEEKNFLYKCLGIIMRKTTKRDFVQTSLNCMFSSISHSSQVEREGCAIALGFAASSHLDTVLSKLESVAKTEMVKKASGFMGFIKDKTGQSDSDIEKVKATVMLCYGFVTLYAPPDLIVSRVEATILRSIIPHFSNVKDYTVKQNLMRATELIGQALHPDHIHQTYNFSNRSELVNHMQAYMKAEGTVVINTETRALAMKTCAVLVKLDPVLSEADLFDLIKMSTDCIYPLPLGGVPTKKVKEENYDKQLEHEVLLEATLESLDDLLKEILKKNMSSYGFESIYKHILPWVLSEQEHERERSIKTMLNLLTCFHDNTQSVPGEATSFTVLGDLLARLTPRCSDPHIPVRQTAIDCVQMSLKIHLRSKGHLPDSKDQIVDALPTLKGRVTKVDPSVLFSVINDLGRALAKKVPADMMTSFMDTLYEGLLDSQSHSSSGACVVLNTMLKSRGAELLSQVPHVLQCLHEKLGQVTNHQQTRTGTLRAVKTLATHHLLVTMTSLLTYHIPFDEHIVDILKIIAPDAQLTASIFDHILELLLRSLPYEEKDNPRDKDSPIRTAMPTPLAATCVLAELFKVEETEEQVLAFYDRLFASLIIRLGSTVGVQPPKPKEGEAKEEVKSPKGKKGAQQPQKKKIVPSNMTVECFELFLERSKSQDIKLILDDEGVWEMFEDEENYPEAFAILARAVCTCKPEQVPKIVANLSPSLSSLYDPQRIVVSSFFAELINQNCTGDMTLVEMLLNNLLGKLVDSSQVVRKLCIKGLGNISSVGKQQVQNYSTTVLSAMMAGMDDKDDIEDEITQESMSGLSKIIAEVDESHIRAILINISLKIRPCFEKDRASVRAAAFTLFGNLSRFGDGPSKVPFLEQIHNNMVSLLLHLNDPEVDVRTACKFALRQVGPLIASEQSNTMFQKHLLDDAHLHYGEFMNNLVKVLILDFPDKINFFVMSNVSFFKSAWPEIKSNAAMFAGFLMGNLPGDRHSFISKEHVCNAFVMLLKDPSSDVRIKAAEAMSWLCDY